MQIWHKVLRGFVFFVFGVLIGVLTARVTDAQAAPAFEPTECPFEAAEGVDCGFVSVPENRADPDSATIRIAIVRVAGTDPDVPVMVLSGGPGEITTPAAGFIAPVFQQIAGGRTLIVFDQRGVGRSEPALACPEWVEAQLASLAPETTPEQALINNNESLLACAERLTAEGIDLSAYNSLENAADVADIAAALGYEQVNLFGISYGSLLAQHVMRQSPELVRAVVIDSVVPLDASFLVESTDTALAAMNAVLAACEAEEACAAAYPDLDALLSETVVRFNAEPMPITVTNPVTGLTYDSLLTGDTILGAIMLNLYQTPQIPNLPQAISAVAGGDTSSAEALASQILGAFYALERGMQYSVMCAEDLLLATEDDYLARMAALPVEYQGRLEIEVLADYTIFDLCAQWPTTPLDVSIKQPITSDLPVLALAGEFDPVTPPRDPAQRLLVYVPGCRAQRGAGQPVRGGHHRPILDRPCGRAGCVVHRVDGGALQRARPSAGTRAVHRRGHEHHRRHPGGLASHRPGRVCPVGHGQRGHHPAIRADVGHRAGHLVERAVGHRCVARAEPDAGGQRPDVGALSDRGAAGLVGRFGAGRGGLLLAPPAERERYYEGLFLPAVTALTRP
ncbi:MAG: alpha/beta hydrolase [Anaerolineae bacterium]|nr:alpha/beta hydrolase [Anaerolineae bacterium]